MAYSLIPRYEANLCVSTSKHNNIIPSHKIKINCLCMYTAVAIDAVAGCRILQFQGQKLGESSIASLVHYRLSALIPPVLSTNYCN